MIEVERLIAILVAFFSCCTGILWMACDGRFGRPVLAFAFEMLVEMVQSSLWQ